MANRNWGKLTIAIDKALDLEPVNRVAFINKECAHDPLLRNEALKFLESIENLKGFWADMLESGSVLVDEITLSGVLSEETELSSPLKQAGPYRIIKLIARGGMGNVYLAERSDGQFKRLAAIKILRRELISEHHKKLFLEERDILSGLEHPNIARLYDAGVADGRPYLIMEYVDGEPITTYCTNNNCTFETKLELFKQVCDAVKFAHRNLIVHRDLKPDNIFVAKEGTVKILDFGIAKALHIELVQENSASKENEPRLFSIQYAAPEQITQDQITISTDIYSLGLLLYELLTGTRPFDLSEKKLKEAEDTILTELPVKPSQKVKRSRLSGMLKGDLDAIILKALNKKPENRYTSVDQLTDDINRFATHRPITALPNKRTYRIWKFIKRRTGVVAGILMVIIGLGRYLITLQMYAERLSVERDAANVALERANKETIKAEQVTAFLFNLFEGADPLVVQDSELTVREVLDRGLNQTESLPDDPEVRSDILALMAGLYRSLGLYETSLTLANQALELRLSTHGKMHQDVVHSLLLLGKIMHNKEDNIQAQEYFTDAIKMGKEILGDEHLLIADALGGLALSLRQTGDLNKAVDALKQAIEILENSGSNDDLMMATNLRNLGIMLWYQYDYLGALKAHIEEVNIRRRIQGDYHLDLAGALHALGTQLINTGNPEGSESALREAIEIRSQILGANHPSALSSKSTLGVALRNQQNYSASEKLLRNIIEIRRTVLGTDSPLVGSTLLNLASTLRKKGDYEEALSILHESLSMLYKTDSENYLRIGQTFQFMAEVERDRGNLAHAEELIREGLDLQKLKHSDREVGLVTGMNLLGIILQEQGKLYEAEQLIRNAILITRKEIGEKNLYLATGMIYLGAVLMTKGDLDGAESFLREGLQMQSKLLGENYHEVVENHKYLERLNELRNNDKLLFIE